jgi:hypothetical protein
MRVERETVKTKGYGKIRKRRSNKGKLERKVQTDGKERENWALEEESCSKGENVKRERNNYRKGEREWENDKETKRQRDKETKRQRDKET